MTYAVGFVPRTTRKACMHSTATSCTGSASPIVAERINSTTGAAAKAATWDIVAVHVVVRNLVHNSSVVCVNTCGSRADLVAYLLFEVEREQIICRFVCMNEYGRL